MAVPALFLSTWVMPMAGLSHISVKPGFGQDGQTETERDRDEDDVAQRSAADPRCCLISSLNVILTSLAGRKDVAGLPRKHQGRKSQTNHSNLSLQRWKN